MARIEDVLATSVTGTVKVFSKRAYGFIESDADGMSFFVHISETGGRYLKPGDRVRFDVGDDPRNKRTKQAMNVVVISSSDSEKDGHLEQEAKRE